MEKIYEKAMKKCLKIALKSNGKNYPNPMVGAVLLDEKGVEISNGYHKMAGTNHAEVNCINNAPSNTDFSKTTLVVNLEPCSHFGKTPPCADLIVKKGIKRVVVGLVDPNEKVKGNGIKKLQENGVEVIYPFMEDECRDFNKIFIKNITQKKPYIAIKTAVTTDGKIGTDTGSSKWITGENSRQFVHKLRSNYTGILTSSSTVLADNPSLNVRYVKGKSPVRIIVDRNFKTDFTYNVYKNDGIRVILATNKNIDAPKHVEVIPFKDFDSFFKDLYKMGIYSLMVEAGSTFVSEIIKKNEADFLHYFMAPKIIGNGKSFVENIKINDINDAIKLKTNSISIFKDDILIDYEFTKNA